MKHPNVVNIHATCVVLARAAPSFGARHDSGVLIMGRSGAGKSDLALRLIDNGAKLIADDQTELRDIGGAARMSAPAAIAGRMEVRGLGIVTVPHQASAPLRLVVDLRLAATIERLPEPAWYRLFAYEIPLLALAPFEASAPAKLRMALDTLSASAAIVDAGRQ
jgi:serine kinase of HPr protein (carbohydrate metabolism regulator)